jgi:uroporphyrinogen-III synthase
VLLPNAGANSESLLQCGEFSADDAGTAIIFCAPHGRDLLQRELGERGWQVHVAEVYQRILQAPTGQTLAEIRAANQLVTVCTSATAITACRERLPADIWQQMTHQPWLVISERLEAIARDAGAREIYQSAAPGNTAISEAIRNIVNT